MKGKFEELIGGEIPVLVDFFAEWCGPCKAMAPSLKRVAATLGNSARIVKIDIDRNRSLAAKYNVSAVPTLIIFKNGKEFWRQTGAAPAHVMEQQLRAAVD